MCSDNGQENPNESAEKEGEKDLKVPVGKRVGELLLYGVFIFVDAEEIWPHSRFLALAIFVLGTLGLLLYDGGFSKRQIFIAIGVAVAASLGLYIGVPIERPPPNAPAQVVVVQPPAAQPPGSGVPRTYEGGAGIPLEDMEVHGVLKPANEPTPPNGCDRQLISPDALKILIGTNAFALEGFGAFTAIAIKACHAVSMERRVDGIFVNASLYDPEKSAVVSIRENRITALSGENYKARQSRDESRLSVKNARGTELFYIRYLNPTIIQFRGFVSCQAGPIIRVQDDQPVPGVSMSGTCGINTSVGIQIGR